MSIFSNYSATLANSLLQLIDPAGTIPVSGAWVPSPFNLVTSFSISGGLAGGAQGLLLTATLPIGGSNTPVAILAFGSRWADFFYGAKASLFATMSATPSYLNLGGLQVDAKVRDDIDLANALAEAESSLELLRLRADENGSHIENPLIALSRLPAERRHARLELDTAAAVGNILALSNSFYSNARSAIWSVLPMLQNVPGFGGQVPLLCVGMGPSAALAQLAALDLRPGQTGPVGATQVSPASDIGCYAFSAAPLGDATFSAAATKAVLGLFSINAPATDFWPNGFGLPSGTLPLGTQQNLTVTVGTTVDTPWYDRTPAVYSQAFGGPVPSATGAGTLTTSPTGFDPRLAAAFAQLTVATYVLCQHPGASLTLPAPYTAVGSVSLTGQTWTNMPWAVLYRNGSNNALVIVIRGPATLAETGFVNGPGYATRPLWMTNGRINGGVLAFADLLLPALGTALTGQSTAGGVYYVGHDYGGSTAATLAYQAQINGTTAVPKAAAVYGFGTQPFADYTLANTLYPASLGAITFQIQRPSDVLTQRVGSGSTYGVPTAIQLTGGDTTQANSTSYHAASLYAQLLSVWTS
ncbi:MAG: hypothetical protein ACOVKO_05495 [Elstera sp.]